MNSTKHGRNAKVVLSVLPHEDPEQLAHKVEDWFAAIEPTNPGERALLARVGQLSYEMERASRSETAYLTRRVRRATRVSTDSQLAKVAELGKKLLHNAGPKILADGPPWPDHPEVFLRGLEQTVEGCEWLLRKWKEMDDLCRTVCDWTNADYWKFIRLQGLQPCEAVNNAFINRQILAFEVIYEGNGMDFWRVVELVTPRLEPAFNWCAKWRELVPRPASWEEACAFVQGIVADQIARLQQLIAEHKEIADEEEMERLDRAAFEASLEMARFQRSQNARGRELHKTIELIMKMRKEGLGIIEEHEPEDEVESEKDPEAESVTVAAVPVASHAEKPAPASEPPGPKPRKADQVASDTAKNAENEAKSDGSQSPVTKKVKAALPESEYAKQTQLFDQVTSWLIANQRGTTVPPQPEAGG